jgi:uncharacterized membrane protein YfcA
MTVSLETLLLLALLGAAIGVFGTLVGAGGGFILTPVLLVIYPDTSASTITAISLVVFFNALSGSLAYARQRRIDYRSGIAFAAATIPGSIAGVLVVGIAPRRVFDALMALLLAAAAVFLVLGRREERGSTLRFGGVRRTITDRAGTTYKYIVNVRLGVLYSLGVPVTRRPARQALEASQGRDGEQNAGSQASRGEEDVVRRETLDLMKQPISGKIISMWI